MVIAWILISGGNFQLRELEPLLNEKYNSKMYRSSFGVRDNSRQVMSLTTPKCLFYKRLPNPFLGLWLVRMASLVLSTRWDCFYTKCWSLGFWSPNGWDLQILPLLQCGWPSSGNIASFQGEKKIIFEVHSLLELISHSFDIIYKSLKTKTQKWDTDKKNGVWRALTLVAGL